MVVVVVRSLVVMMVIVMVVVVVTVTRSVVSRLPALVGVLGLRRAGLRFALVHSHVLLRE